MEAATGLRTHFSVLATTTPKPLVNKGARQAVVIFNNTAGNIQLGVSGTVSSLGMIVPTNTVFHDLFSSDEWWVITASGSGTVSGYVVT